MGIGRRIFGVVLFAIVCAVMWNGCYRLQKSSGGGQTDADRPRTVNAADVAVPEGFRVEAVARNLTFPTGVAFDERGAVHVVEAGYSYGEVWTTPRLLRVEPDGTLAVIASGGKNGPWTGVDFSGGHFYVAEGGELEGGRIIRIAKDGKITPLIENLPSRGDHHTNGPVIGPDGSIYFAVGTATNSGVVGVDNDDFGWLRRSPDFHDIPCEEIILAGRNFTTPNPLTPDSNDTVITGAFVPFGISTEEGQVIEGEIPCSGSVLRIDPAGRHLELVAWGFRNPFGLAFSPDGRLFATENQYDNRGSRPVFGAGDLLWEVRAGTWYGWPDFHAGDPLDKDSRYQPPGKKEPPRLLWRHPGNPPEPAAVFGVHSASCGIDFARNPGFGYPAEAFVAQFGDQAPATGKVLAPVGFKVVRVNPETGTIADFAVNRSGQPASRSGGGGLERPLGVKFAPDGMSLYVVDFGVLIQTDKGAFPKRETGVLWRITRQ